MAINLTGKAEWQWQIVSPEKNYPEHSSLESLLSDCNLPFKPFLEWPTKWKVFYTAEEVVKLKARGARHGMPCPESAFLHEIPDQLEYLGRQWHAQFLSPNSSGYYDLEANLGQAFDGRIALLYAPLLVSEPKTIHIYASADYRMDWWINANLVYSTLKQGNGGALLENPHSFSIDFAPGRYVLAVRVISGSGGWAMASEALATDSGTSASNWKHDLRAKKTFYLTDFSQMSSLTFDGGSRNEVRLNGKRLPRPYASMQYGILDGIPKEMLRKGENQLDCLWPAKAVDQVKDALGLKIFNATSNGALPRIQGDLWSWGTNEAQLKTTPILGNFSQDRLSLTCRTTALVSLDLTIGGKTLTSKSGLLHRFEITGLEPGREYPYALRASGEDASGEALFSAKARTLSEDKEHQVVFCGDVYPFDDTWPRIARQIVQYEPAAVFFSGDMVLDGRIDEQWDKGFFAPAQQLFATIPFYPVIGNHEYDTPLFDDIFLSPSPRNWVEAIGALQVIGVDGARDWSPGNGNFEWLEANLSSSSSPYIFLMTHYPPYSSGGHGVVNENGIPLEKTIQQARGYLVPLLTHYGVQAIFSGHDHFYERSELPGGLSAIVSAGAGSRLYSKTKNPQQNPYSQVWESDYHFCRVSVSPSGCSMEVIAIGGDSIDQKVWRPRPAVFTAG